MRSPITVEQLQEQSKRRIELADQEVEAYKKSICLRPFAPTKLSVPFVKLDAKGVCVYAWHIPFISKRRISYLIPKETGIYMLVSAYKEIVYIGSTRNINRRVPEHLYRKKIPFIYATWFCLQNDVSKKDLEDGEYAIMRAFSKTPKYNKIIKLSHFQN